MLPLARYSPEWNAIEHAWGKLKQNVRSVRADTSAALGEAASAAIETITTEDARGWIGLNPKSETLG